MIRLPLLSLALPFLLVTPVTLGQPATEPHIVDGTLDPVVSVRPLMFGMADPSVDLRSVTFSREGDNLVTRVRVEDADWSMPRAVPQYKQVVVHFKSDTHGRVVLNAQMESDGWQSYLTCETAWELTCLKVLGPSDWDMDADTLTFTVPLEILNGRVLQPYAYAYAEYFFGADPLLSFQDEAPDQPIIGEPQYGRDFDPYA